MAVWSAYRRSDRFGHSAQLPVYGVSGSWPVQTVLDVPPELRFPECGFTSGRIVRHSSKARASSRCRLNSNFVVYGCGNSLDTAEVALSRLNRDMAEKELNLLQFASGCPT